MMYVNPSQAEKSLYHNFPPYLLSDIGSVDRTELLLCELPDRRVTSRFLTLEERSESGTKSIVVSASGPNAIAFRAMSERILRLVVSRRPVAHQPYPEQAPSYLLAYVTELLECGHSQDVHFSEGVENLTAKRRVCHECAVTKKKPSASVRFPALKREAM